MDQYAAIAVATTLFVLAGEYTTADSQFAQRLADHLTAANIPFIFSRGRGGCTVSKWHNPPPKTRELIRELRRLQQSKNQEVAAICARAEGLLARSQAPAST